MELERLLKLVQIKSEYQRTGDPDPVHELPVTEQALVFGSKEMLESDPDWVDAFLKDPELRQELEGIQDNQLANAITGFEALYVECVKWDYQYTVDEDGPVAEAVEHWNALNRVLTSNSAKSYLDAQRLDWLEQLLWAVDPSNAIESEDAEDGWESVCPGISDFERLRLHLGAQVTHTLELRALALLKAVVVDD